MFKEFTNMMHFAVSDLERIKKENELFELFMNCKSAHEVIRVERLNWEFMCQHPYTFDMSKRALKRIHRINRQKKESWRLQIN